MIQMLTLFGKDISKLSYNELKRELRSQKFIRTTLKCALIIEGHKNDKYKEKQATEDSKLNQRSVRISDDKVALLEIYIENLDALCKELEYYTTVRLEPESNAYGHKSRKSIRDENAKKRRVWHLDGKNKTMQRYADERDGLLVSWDKERFMLVAADNGFQTEDAVMLAVAEELNLDRNRARAILDGGRFTWGQVLCLGAFLQMTPKEFCDVFLADYFVEQHGEYRADYENLCKEELLRKAIKPGVAYAKNLVTVEVGADGRPLDEEEWFTD